jgi:bifunctional DNA-binding transcriptional regulator/antitoxin component of YhaV-PrlF toxin-antitoxin module
MAHLREMQQPLVMDLTVAPNGRLVIPVAMRQALGVADGGKLIARQMDGRLVLEPVDLAIQRAQAMVRRYVPAGTSLADELITERRAAADD